MCAKASCASLRQAVRALAPAFKRCRMARSASSCSDCRTRTASLLSPPAASAPLHSGGSPLALAAPVMRGCRWACAAACC
eukprot:1188072-Lingulodinium_polyedra.AAC.1